MTYEEAYAELLGLHAGDGTIYKTARSHVWELRGNNDEKEFYDTYIIPLLRKIYDYPFIGKHRSGGANGCYGVRCCQKAFIQLFFQAGIPSGRKTNKVSIPAMIIRGNDKQKKAFLRGIFAADGTAYMTKTNYPVIEVASASKSLRDQISSLLLHFSIKHYHWTYTTKKKGGPSYCLRIFGERRCALFMQTIGLSNPKHKQRI